MPHPRFYKKIITQDRKLLKKRVVLTTLFFTAGSYLVDALVDLFFFDHDNLTEVLIPTDAGEIYMRSAMVLILCLFGVQVYHLLSNRLQVEEQLVEKTRQLVQAQSIALLGDWSLDLDNGVTHWSEQALEILGRQEDVALESFQDFLEQIHPKDRSKVDQALEEVLLRCERLDLQFRLVTRKGREKHLKMLGEINQGEAGQRVLVGILQDITELALKSRELDTARLLAEDASNAKSIFLANVSHELRTPMNGVMGMASLLEASHLDAEQMHFVQAIKTSSQNLLSIINEILDLSKIESGQMRFERFPFDLRSCLENALESFALVIAGKKLDLFYQVLEDVPELVITDEKRLRQILLNLLSNATKFTEKGEVSLEVSLKERDEDQATLRFAIRDTGIGIEESKLGLIFDSFVQADQGNTKAYEGTGLGLTISRKLAEKLEGSLGVESKLGKGSVFTLEMPVGLMDLEEDPELDLDLDLSPTKVLLIDFNLARSRAMAALLHLSGMTVVEPDSIPDLANLLETEGLVFLDQAFLEELETPHQNLLVEALKAKDAKVILAQWVNQELPTDLLEALPLFALSKPVRLSWLHQALEKAMGYQREQLQVFDGSLLPSHLGKDFPLRILLAEDHRVNRMLAIKMLDKLGYDCDQVENGLEVIQALENNSYDLILMDIQMPEMDGLEASSLIHRKFPGNNRPVLVAMTAHAPAEDRDRFLAQGMDDYLPKPLMPKDVQALLFKWGRRLKDYHAQFPS